MVVYEHLTGEGRKRRAPQRWALFGLVGCRSRPKHSQISVCRRSAAGPDLSEGARVQALWASLGPAYGKNTVKSTHRKVDDALGCLSGSRPSGHGVPYL